MTCIIIHKGFIVADSAVRTKRIDMSGVDDLSKLSRLIEPIKIWSERDKFEDTALAFAFTGPRGAVAPFINRMTDGVPLDNIVDFYAEIRSSGLADMHNSCSIAIICVHQVYVVELNILEERTEFFPHGNLAEHEPYPRLFGMGSGSGHLETVVDIFNTFQRRLTIQDMKDAGVPLNPMAIAISCGARDPDSGHSYGLWRVVPDGKGSADVMFFGRRSERDEDRLQAIDLTELIPLDVWNDGGELPYDPITYPAPPPYSKDQPQKETPDVAGKAVPEAGDRSPEGKGPEGRSRVPRTPRKPAGADRRRKRAGNAG